MHCDCETTVKSKGILSQLSFMHALSIPTWVIHVSSVLEWVVAIWLIWTYGDVTQNRSWRSLSFAMLPALVSAMCACTWHFFDNAKSLEWLVIVQASMTLVGNITLMAAGWWIWHTAKQSETHV
jgi:hypothetical protein